MSIIREKIRFTGNDQNITIPIAGNNGQLGFQQEINEFVLEKTIGSINGITDVEIKRYPFQTYTIPKILKFEFYDSSDDNWYPYFTTAGFTVDEIEEKSENYLNSFFILDFFDTYEESEQIKLFSTYLTNLTSTNTGVGYSRYELTTENEFYYLNVPKNVNAGVNTYTGYVRFSFYNAKTGKISVMYNKQKNGTPEKMYFEVDIFTNRWNFNYRTGEYSIRELPYDANKAYLDKYNDTFGDFIDEQQNYPAGSIFIDDGTYEFASGGTATSGRISGGVTRISRR